MLGDGVLNSLPLGPQRDPERPTNVGGRGMSNVELE